ncbi:Gfo/Idh/MocA family oxidoreductase [Actinopolymorpha sp. B11F2]|uniref:Gfo/Idh/MocA family protein n=1 Tax=Actinopolymorpha sp. B11F2 TaxID=3160862 RepID=UPI0032E530A7
MKRRLRVAIIGAGVGAEHLVGYLLNPRAYDVTTICDLDRQRGEGLAGMVSTARSATDVDQVLSDPGIDLVSVCTPPFTHLDLALRALEAGKHVVVEKPVAASPAEVDQLAAAGTAAGRVVVPVFQYRFARGPRLLRRLIAADLAGPPVAASLEVHWDRGADYYAVPWRGRRETELGGTVMSHLIHAHDLLTYLAGPVVRVQAEVATLVHQVEVEDTAAVTMRLENGALASSSATIGAAGNTSRYRFVFAGLTAQSGAAPYAPGEDPWTFTARDPARQGELDALVKTGDRPRRNGFAGLFEALAPALSGHADPPVSLVDAHAAISLAAAIYHSARTSSGVDLPLSPDHPAYQTRGE